MMAGCQFKKILTKTEGHIRVDTSPANSTKEKTYICIICVSRLEILTRGLLAFMHEFELRL